MDQKELIKKLREVQFSESTFTKIMHACSMKELIELNVSPDEVLSYFKAAEELGRIEEESINFQFIVVQRLKEACPVKQRRAFFI